MGFLFKDKTVYILSSEKWGTMRISKHHYAIELAERGNEVYFIEPPDLNNKGIRIVPSGEHASLYVVKYRPIYRGKRFLPGFIYRVLIWGQITYLRKAIGKLPDVVWCFDPYRFLNLTWFKAPVSIFFAADLFSQHFLPEESLTADICFGVSDSIIDLLKLTGKNVQFINHGLNRFFAETATGYLSELKNDQSHPKEDITVGYVGNLLMEAPDRETMRQVITAHPNIKFIFWGQYEKEGNLVAFNNPQVFAFIEFLRSQPNVILRGAVHPSVLSEECKKVDIFWLCWQLNISKIWDGSNSHKVMEYLSTGKPVVSHYISTYKDSNLVDMLKTRDNSGYADLFARVVRRVKEGEPVDRQRERIIFSMSNTYQSHISSIEALVARQCS
ncbi:glycosyltransferase family 1 protein [Pseudoflavitalea sp. X16]|uniref:glycosyltransferase family 1 protein n=1 Tax=Paraflavitalea devenefica TaxID=2716334 RepID=UPI00141E9091|nr:glycosyltransferase family 1 protein [Paraflavitalea devenefica]NII24084.1 glycosyltransferase family 1 protein [Paraflavitalea devenefica]